MTATEELDLDDLVLEDPTLEDGWKVYSFSRRHAAFRHPNTLGVHIIDGEPTTNDRRLNAKLRNGLAFFLSYFQHGPCLWFLHGECPPGVEFQWDGVRVAGLLVWEDPAGSLGSKTFEDRRADAEEFLTTYTKWCNGGG